MTDYPKIAWMGVMGSLLMLLPVHLQASQDPKLKPLSGINRPWLDRIQEAPSWGRNPFNYPRGEETQGTTDSGIGLNLSAIMYRQGGGVAIINHQVIRQGDSIGGRKVVSILRDRVFLQDAGGMMELKLSPFGLK